MIENRRWIFIGMMLSALFAATGCFGIQDEMCLADGDCGSGTCNNGICVPVADTETESQVARDTGTETADTEPEDPCAVDIDSGLKAQYLFNGDFSDRTSGGRDAHGVRVTFEADRFGNEGGAASFTEVDATVFEDSMCWEQKPSYVMIPAAVDPGGAAWSWSAWVRVDDLSNPGLLLGRQNSWAEWTDNYAYVRKDNHTIGTYSDGANVSSNYLPVEGEWFHLMFAVNGTSIAFYVNGTLTNYDGAFPNADSSAAFASGVSEFYLSAPIICLEEPRHFMGDMDDVRFYDRALGASEAAALYARESGDDPICGDGDIHAGLHDTDTDTDTASDTETDTVDTATDDTDGGQSLPVTGHCYDTNWGSDGCYTAAMETMCADEYADCLGNEQCSFYHSCLQQCAESVGQEWYDCTSNCKETYSAGVHLMDAFYSCVYCDACSEDCFYETGYYGCGVVEGQCEAAVDTCQDIPAESVRGCLSCAAATECSSQNVACASSAACDAYGQCLGTCSQISVGAEQNACIADCREATPAKDVALYEAYQSCLYCDACPDSCAAESDGICDPADTETDSDTESDTESDTGVIIDTDTVVLPE